MILEHFQVWMFSSWKIKKKEERKINFSFDCKLKDNIDKLFWIDFIEILGWLGVEFEGVLHYQIVLELHFNFNETPLSFKRIPERGVYIVENQCNNEPLFCTTAVLERDTNYILNIH